jgi:hypothetical protein
VSGWFTSYIQRLTSNVQSRTTASLQHGLQLRHPNREPFQRRRLYTGLAQRVESFQLGVQIGGTSTLRLCELLYRAPNLVPLAQLKHPFRAAVTGPVVDAACSVKPCSHPPSRDCRDGQALSQRQKAMLRNPEHRFHLPMASRFVTVRGFPEAFVCDYFITHGRSRNRAA